MEKLPSWLNRDEGCPNHESAFVGSTSQARANEYTVVCKVKTTGPKPRVQLKPQTCIYSIAHSPPQTQFLETVCPGALAEDQYRGGGQLSSHAKKVSFVIIYPDGNLSKTS